MSAAVAAALFGFYVIYSNKEMMKKQHFMTLHGKVGLAVTVSYLMIGIFGAVALHPGRCPTNIVALLYLSS